MEAYPTSQPGSFSASSPPTASSPPLQIASTIDANGKGRAAIQVDGACYREWGYPKAQRQQHKDQFKSQPQTGWQPITTPPPPTCPPPAGGSGPTGGIGALVQQQAGGVAP